MGSAGDFTRQAAAYAARPGYPAELVDLLIQDAAVHPGDPTVDIGAGTGLFTRELIARGFAVTAIEPNEKMRSQADLPAAMWIDGTFEDTQLTDASQRWAVAAQAFHWADPQRALSELHRVLQPGCLFTALWNVKVMDANPILRWIADAIRRQVPNFREHYDGRDWPMVLASTGDFAFVGMRSARHIVPMSRERFLDLWRSHHWLQQLATPGAFDALMVELEEHLGAEVVSQVPLPYDCVAYSARRLD